MFGNQTPDARDPVESPRRPRRGGVRSEPAVMSAMSAMSLRSAGPPLTVAVAHSKGGVGKTTTALLLGRFLAERVALVRGRRA